MNELFDTLQSHESNDSHMRDLGLHSQLETLEDAQASYAVALAAVQAVLSDCAASPEAVEQLQSAARAFKWADRNDPTRLFSGAEAIIGEQISQTIFGENLPAVESYLTDQTNISAESATDILQVVSAVTLATAVGTPGEEADLVARIDSDISAASHPAVVATRSQTKEDPNAVAESVSTENDSALVNNELQQRQKRIAIGTAAAVVIAGLFFVVSNGSGDEPADALASTDSSITEPMDDTNSDGGSTQTGNGEETGQATTDDENGSENTDGTTAVDGSSQDGNGTDETAAQIVTYNVPMVDIVTTERDAEGLLSFDFNTDTGEVCYRVISNNIDGPYRTHIHVGGSDEKGGIVVDMGPQESGAAGCLQNPPADIKNILADLENHYAELHDVSEEWTIRGQLSEALEQSGAVQVDLQFDPDSEGAFLAIENGIAILRGEVPDLLTATALSALYAPGGTGLVLTSELTISDNAPVPSGRIVLADYEYFVASSDMPEIDAATEAALKAILDAQDGWKLTAVGRTDSDGSELNNLELSLRRAKSLRTYIEEAQLVEDSVFVRGAGDLGAQGRNLELEFVPQD